MGILTNNWHCVQWVVRGLLKIIQTPFRGSNGYFWTMLTDELALFFPSEISSILLYYNVFWSPFYDWRPFFLVINAGIVGEWARCECFEFWHYNSIVKLGEFFAKIVKSWRVFFMGNFFWHICEITSVVECSVYHLDVIPEG